MTECIITEIREAFSALIEKCQEQESRERTTGDSSLLMKCRQKCTDLLQKETLWSKDICQVLQEFAQAVFDFTYHDECKLVDEEFPESNSRERIQIIFDNLDQILELAKRLNPGKEVSCILGDEITECLFWRRGALLYMYCSTVQEKEDRLNKQKQEFVQNLNTGISSLKRMLEARGKNSEEKLPDEARNDNTLSLINIGVYSDTHLLAMMYAGEMCYWYCSKDLPREVTLSDIKEIKTLGTNLLSLYVEAIKGPLSGQGWSTDRAEELLKLLSM